MDILRIINTSVLIIALTSALTVVVLVTQPILPFVPSYQRDFEGANPENLTNHVKILSSLDRASTKGKWEVAEYIQTELRKTGIGTKDTSSGAYAETQEFRVDGEIFQNIIVHFNHSGLADQKAKKIIIGAHYDTDGKIAGADDNASGVAGLLEAARILREMLAEQGNPEKKRPSFDRDIELVFYANEEMPYFGTDEMGSYAHAKNLQSADSIALVIVLEMIGYFSQEEDSQDVPIRGMRYIYPTTGNFIALVSNLDHISEIRSVKKIFRSILNEHDLIGVRSINAPSTISGIDFSDHRNYWQFGIPAIMVTDTAFYRNHHYHTPQDTYEKLDYERMTEVVDAVLATAIRY